MITQSITAIEKAGLRYFRTHDLHTSASLLIQAGASLAYVQDQLGPVGAPCAERECRLG
jgi:integrase